MQRECRSGNSPAEQDLSRAGIACRLRAGLLAFEEGSSATTRGRALLYDIPTAAIVGGLLLAMLVTVDLGVRLGARREAERWTHSRDLLVAISGSALALLGLMLAFSFSISAQRFEERVHLLEREASGIIRAADLTDLLLPAPREAALADLRDFARSRLEFRTVGNDPAGEHAAIMASRAAHDRLWSTVHRADAYTPPETISLALLAPAVLDLATVARERELARALRLPGAVLLMLLVLAVASAGTVAYAFGASGQGGRAPTILLLMLVCVVIYIIIDLDRPRRGLMSLDPTPLREALAFVEGKT